MAGARIQARLEAHPLSSTLAERENSVRAFVFGVAAAALFAVPAAAETYQASGVRIEDAAAIVQIIPENRSNVDVTIQAGGRLRAPSVRVVDGRVEIDGGLRLTGCSSDGGGHRVRVAGQGWVRDADLTRITIRTPRTLDVTFGGGGVARIGASEGGRVSLTGCGDAEIAAVRGDLTLALTGSGDAQLAHVSGALSASLTGSGDLEAAGVGGDARVRLTGSGDAQFAAISGALDARVTGSGDVDAGDVGAVTLALTGSGDVTLGAVRGAFEAQTTGSGDVSVRVVEGPHARMRISGSGDIAVRGGRVARLEARTGGSGGVTFAGAAEVVDVETRGSGGVHIGSAGRIERMVSSGSGRVHVGR